MSPPWMPLYIADYLADTEHLGALESGGYMHLIMHYWRHGSLPKEDASLARIARMKPREWSRSKTVILAFFNLELCHKRIDIELRKASITSKRRSESGFLGGTSKALKTKEPTLANAKHLPDICQAFALASSSQPESERKEEQKEPRAKIALDRSDEKIAFDRFWKIWPNRVGKPPAERAFGKCWQEADAIIAGVASYQRDKPPDRPWLNPATFLNQRRWEDSPAPSVQGRAENRNGFASLLSEMRKQEHDRQSDDERYPATVDLLPLHRDDQPIAGGGDGDGLYGNAERFRKLCDFKRM